MMQMHTWIGVLDRHVDMVNDEHVSVPLDMVPAYPTSLCGVVWHRVSCPGVDDDDDDDDGQATWCVRHAYICSNHLT